VFFFELLSWVKVEATEFFHGALPTFSLERLLVPIAESSTIRRLISSQDDAVKAETAMRCLHKMPGCSPDRQSQLQAGQIARIRKSTGTFRSEVHPFAMYAFHLPRTAVVELFWTNCHRQARINREDVPSARSGTACNWFPG
jgi:hypothetical protein